ncbi:hypothetical protein CONLIGDRAFT_601103 [Coniochaeta ligniaria NRRL 30616]|uniref:SEC7 domain-containing protein n=1 Tax=Coniochaeta ligniaria NRRL 30616 TaxID=1408157 RepID=A0A1J7JG11_9PEZI|nr:hypothetical protein CONLIGDRAFT_601103 [Coniochaeta ligniaria NRRL 30616]
MPTNPSRDARDLETFLDSLTPIDTSNKENDRPREPPQPNYRDSHDLSLSPRQVTRDSLVTNMLLSLDQFSMGQTSAPFGSSRAPFDDPTAFSSFGGDDGGRSTTFNSKSGRPAGHGYSYSSDFEGGDDSSRISSQPSRGRRSNSSSGFQSSLGRINSMREVSHQRGSPPTTRPLHSRSGRGSKSSSTNSIDPGYAQVLSSQRWAQGFGARSSSFDYGHGRASTATGAQPPQWHIEFSNTFFNDELDAAPTPTVPGGPRRLAAVPSLPVLPVSEPPTSPAKGPVLERKRSSRSSKSAIVGRKADTKFNTARNAPPLPTFDLDSAPAPHVGYEKSKEVLSPVTTATATPAKDKPGFFRRMFGSSKNNLTSTTQSSSSAFISSTSVDTSGSRTPQHLNSMKSQSTPPSRESHHSTAHGLQKKTSSFFRRRKHSVSDAEPPPLPLPPLVLPTVKLPVAKAGPELLSAKPEPSPITSLRRAMDPFMHSNPNTPEVATPGSFPSPLQQELAPEKSSDVAPMLSPKLEKNDEYRRRTTRGFSPDYEPSPKALIRAVETESGDGRTAKPTQTDTPTRRAPDPPSMTRSGSFFHDNSDDESSPRRRSSRAAQGEGGDRGLQVDSQAGDKRSPRLSTKGSEASISAGDGSKSKHGLLLLPSSPTKSDEARSSLALPIEGVLASGPASPTDTLYQSAHSLPSVKVDSAEPSPQLKSSKSIDEPDFVVGDPTEDDMQKAQKIYDGNEDFIQRDRAAAWMGEEGPVRQRTLRAYMDLYDFQDKSVVTSLRQMCNRLVLRAETQQVDRILVAFAKRWCDCNPNHGFKATDVIHTICYSIMLLNTDLHMADIEQKMTRSQFVKNTMTTLRQAVGDSGPETFDRPSILPSKGQNLQVEGENRNSVEQDRPSGFRASFMPPPRPDSALGTSSNTTHDSCGPLVKAPFDGPRRAWETQVEIVLKDIYTSIRDERLPLFGAEAIPTPHSGGGLSVMGMLKRSPSVLSKAPSESVSSLRGRISENPRASASRWTSKSRSRQRGFGNGGFSSSRTSFEDGNSIWSPTESSATWSRYSLGRTQASMSMDSFGTGHSRGDYQQSIGFANALSQAIIREDNDLFPTSSAGDEVKPAQLLEDESLELAGSPWVKEGMVVHKHHLDGIDKKAKDRTWTEVFAVIQKGQMSLFSFTPNKSLRHKKSRLAGGTLPKNTVVGGGNWQENATNLGTFALKQTLASTLPPPGYSKGRPHVWALSLPTGAVHLFQVGTPENSIEFVNAANYWSARLSTHPLVGGISNVEYGWSEAIINNILVQAIDESASSLNNRPGTGISASIKGHSRPGSAANAASIMSAAGGGGRRMSIRSQSSVRSHSFDFPRPGSGSSGALGMTMTGGSASRHGKLPGDRIHIAEWTPPAQSLRASTASEAEQLRILENYVRSVEEELQAHNGLRSPMLLAFTPRGGNAARAMSNWQKKSQYLLREIGKYRNYVDALKQAEVRRGEVYEERERARRAAAGEVASLSGEEDEHEDEGVAAAETTEVAA